MLCKGAPEIIKKLLKVVPEGYDKCFRSYVERGCRVLALASKDLDKSLSHSQMTREEAESDLKFAGFFVLGSQLKPDTKKVINILRKAQYKVKIITGDNCLTAAYIGKVLHLSRSSKALFLKQNLSLNTRRGEE